MKQLVIISGKGGTGKTSVAAGIAHLAAETHKVVIADADVDAANLGLVLSPTQLEKHNFTGGKIAVIDPVSCTSCGICSEVCRFEAVLHERTYSIDPIACEGCATCYYQCPSTAIKMVPQEDGYWAVANTRFGLLYHAHLYAGQENSGKLVTLVKSKARQHALDDEVDLLLVDGPPGIGCPVIAAVAGADLILIVTEPSVSGAHDMERIIGLAAHFHIPAAVIINKEDLNSTQADVIGRVCSAHDVPIVGRIPYNSSVTETMVRGLPMTTLDSPVTIALHQAWDEVQDRFTQI